MASRENPHECLQSARERLAEQRGEPIETKDRKVVNNNGGLYANLTSLGVAHLNVKAGDTVAVAVHDDRIVIRNEEA
jgi:hypothetical protein